MALGKLHSPRAPSREGNDRPLLRTHYLENTEKGCHVRKDLMASGHDLKSHRLAKAACLRRGLRSRMSLKGKAPVSHQGKERSTVVLSHSMKIGVCVCVCVCRHPIFDLFFKAPASLPPICGLRAIQCGSFQER